MSGCILFLIDFIEEVLEIAFFGIWRAMNNFGIFREVLIEIY
jgi:hypothetical protein